MVNVLTQDENAKILADKIQPFVGKAFLRPATKPIPSSPSMNATLAYGRHLRDTLLWQEGILSGAVQVYQQLASSREWVVSGKPRPASRAVDFLNATRSVDMNTGYTVEGFEEYLRRRALDYICIGRVAFINRPVDKVGGRTILEYADPTDLHFSRSRDRNTVVSDDELVWTYYGVKFRHDQVFLGHAIPIGSKGHFLAPLTSVVPSMMLQYLVREHDTAALDGRRVRDIIVVANDQMKNAMITAIQTQVALWAGVNVASESGIPVVAVNQPSQTKMSDMVARLSLSNLPEEFNREEFTFEYVNQIASALGLALRHFWNNEKTTNRALEEIQEQRQQRKGPSEFVNTEQRLINRSNILSQFGGRVRFGFIEEIDSQSQLKRAEVLKNTVEALSVVQQVFGATLSLDAMLAWMQSEQVLPNELQLIEGNAEATQINPDDQTQSEGESTTPGNPTPTALPEREKAERGFIPDYDEVTVNSRGVIVERRVKVFSAANYLAALTDQNGDDQEFEKREPPPDDEMSFEDVVRTEQTKTANAFVDAYRKLGDELFVKVGDIHLYDDAIVRNVATRAAQGESLSGEDYTVLTLLLDRLESPEDNPMEDL